VPQATVVLEAQRLGARRLAVLVEDWVELIKNVLSPAAFKDVAIAALRGLYGKPITLADGTGDGGVDAWLELASGRVPVQLHAGRTEAWDAKLARDLTTHALLKRSGRMFFVCAQTPAAESQQKKVAALEATHGVTITVIDARGIASMANDPAVIAALSRSLSAVQAECPPRPSGPAIDARLAFTFFHEKSGDFRAEVARSVLAACLLREAEPIPTEALLDRAIVAAGIGESVRRSFRRELEALEGEHKIEVTAAGVTASSALQALTRTALDIQEIAAARLREDCIRALDGRVHSDERRKDAVDDIFDDLGLLLRESLAEMLPGRSSDAIARRFDAVERRLSDYLKPSGGSASEAVAALVGVASASHHGRALAAAELFIQMTDRESGQLATALAQREDLVIWLDASVALPMLCGKLDRVAEGWATSEIAVELHRTLSEREIKVLVPSVYLQEMAAHLVDAARRYRSLVGADPDLARSENFYVAHFHAVAQRRGEPTSLARFDEFLQDLGLPRQWEGEQRDYLRLRRTIEISLEAHLKRYGLGVHRLISAEALALPEEPGRSEIVLRHDRCVARDLEEIAKTEDQGVLLCSEDRWFVRVLTEKYLLALHPAVLLDVLELVRPCAEPRRLAAVRELAATFSERAVTEGAAVWDLLAELEDPDLADRALLRRAREFKEEWLRRANHEERPRASDWQRFKASRSFGR
jgi:hypothetical protein